MDESDDIEKHPIPAFLRGGGKCAALIDRFDWSGTSLGPIEQWPASLRATVANLLHTRQPMLLFWGPDLVQLYNDSFVPSFGRGKHPAAMGQPARECWAEAWPVIGAQIEAVMSRGEPAWHEDALVPIERNGRMEEVFWTYSYSPAFDDDGAIVGTLVVVTEVTRRVLSARRLEALASLSTELSRVSNPAEVLEAFTALRAEQPEDLPFVIVCERSGNGMRVERESGLTAEEARAMVAEVADRVAAGAHLDLPPETAVRGSVWPEPITQAFVSDLVADRPRRCLLFGLSPRLPFDDDYRGYLGQITEQLGAAQRRLDHAEASRVIEEQRDSLLMQAPVATALLVGPDHVYRLANPPYCELVGRDPTGLTYLGAFPELEGTELPRILDHVYQTGEPFVASEMPIAFAAVGREAASERYVNFNLEALRAPDGSVYGMMAVAVDVTAQVRARKELERIDDERRGVMEALREANRAKDEFLAMLGHELRNPLAPIVSALELMKLEGREPSPRLDMVERHVRHVIRLVDDLLDVARITRGMISLELRPVDLRDVVTTAVELGWPLIEKRSHRVTVDVPEGIALDADEARLVQVVSNLLTNAARYTPEGGEIRVMGRREGATTELRVVDTGQGMEAEQLDHVFELFTQGERTADRAEGGLGIGLALVRSIVELHGGEVSAHSEGRGRGTELVVRLPLGTGAPPAEARGAPADRSREPAAPARVLIVDDNEDAAVLLSAVIRRCGHETAVATHPAQALEIAADLRPEVAVLDVGLPEMDGHELGARLRTIVPDCRLIALTGYGQQSDHQRSTEAGFEAHLVKPVETRALLDLLARPAR